MKNLEICENLSTHQTTSSCTSWSSVMPGGIENYLKWPKAYGFIFVHLLITSADLNTASSFKCKKKRGQISYLIKMYVIMLLPRAKQTERNFNFCGNSSKRVGVHNSLQTYGVPVSATVIKRSEESW